MEVLLRQMLLPLHLKRCVLSADRNEAVESDISNFAVPDQMWMKAPGTFSSLAMLQSVTWMLTLQGFLALTVSLKELVWILKYKHAIGHLHRLCSKYL